jgi:hypothetical protein
MYEKNRVCCLQGAMKDRDRSTQAKILGQTIQAQVATVRVFCFKPGVKFTGNFLCASEGVPAFLRVGALFS